MATSSICLECKDKSCVKTGSPCKDVEKILKKVTRGRRNWLTIVDPRLIEKHLYKSKETGHKKPLIDYDILYGNGGNNEEYF